MSLQSTTTVTTGLSHFHEIMVTVCKISFLKSKPKAIVYRSYMKLAVNAFQGGLKLKLRSINNYKYLESVFVSALNKHAPLKKYEKKLRKVIMKHSELESKHLKNTTNININITFCFVF